MTPPVSARTVGGNVNLLAAGRGLSDRFDPPWLRTCFFSQLLPVNICLYTTWLYPIFYPKNNKKYRNYQAVPVAGVFVVAVADESNH